MALRTLEWLEWDQEPEPLDFVIWGLLSGTLGALISPGGAGKSILVLQILLLVSCGIDLLGLGTSWKTGEVAYLPAEDPGVAIKHRLHALKSHITRDQYDMARERIAIYPLIGLSPDIDDERWYEAIRNITGGKRLLVIDTLRRFHRRDENHSGDMAYIIARLEAIAHETGCTIVFVHHSGKAAALNGLGDLQQASRGASVLVDNIRWQAYLLGMTAENAKDLDVDPEQRGYYVKFGLSKHNYGSPFAEKWLQRQAGGILLPAILDRKAKTTAGTKGKASQTSMSPLDMAIQSKHYRRSARGE